MKIGILKTEKKKRRENNKGYDVNKSVSFPNYGFNENYDFWKIGN